MPDLLEDKRIFEIRILTLGYSHTWLDRLVYTNMTVNLLHVLNVYSEQYLMCFSHRQYSEKQIL